MKTCKKCGGIEYNLRGKCIPCEKIYQKEYHQKNILRRKSNQKLADAKRYEANPEKARNACRKYHAENKAQIVARHKRYAQQNPVLYCIYSSNRRAKTRSSGKLSKDISINLFKLQRGKCACCRNHLEKYHLDHRMPLALGGLNTDDNIQLLCPTCNHQKHAKHPIDFMQSKGYLL